MTANRLVRSSSPLSLYFLCTSSIMTSISTSSAFSRSASTSYSSSSSSSSSPSPSASLNCSLSCSEWSSSSIPSTSSVIAAFVARRLFVNGEMIAYFDVSNNDVQSLKETRTLTTKLSICAAQRTRVAALFIPPRDSSSTTRVLLLDALSAVRASSFFEIPYRSRQARSSAARYSPVWLFTSLHPRCVSTSELHSK